MRGNPLLNLILASLCLLIAGGVLARLNSPTQKPTALPSPAKTQPSATRSLQFTIESPLPLRSLTASLAGTTLWQSSENSADTPHQLTGEFDLPPGRHDILWLASFSETTPSTPVALRLRFRINGENTRNERQEIIFWGRDNPLERVQTIAEDPS